MGNLAAPVEDWTVGGTALTSLMDVERRHGTQYYNTPFIFNPGPILSVKICIALVSLAFSHVNDFI